jgi:hypothetical protein
VAWIWWEELDLSTLTYPQFLAYFFDRPIVRNDESYDLFRKGIDNFYAYDPATVASHVRDLCRSFADLAKIYSDEQLNQGLWAVFSAGIACQRFCFDPQVDTSLRTDAIESMYIPVRDVAVSRAVELVKDSFFFMWWDLILDEFWHSTGQHNFDHSGLNAEQLIEKYRQMAFVSYDYAALTNDQKLMVDTMFRSLQKILALDHQGCQWCALHGLGHLNHPSGPEIVQGYLDRHRTELIYADLQWVEQCRDGRCQ